MYLGDKMKKYFLVFSICISILFYLGCGKKMTKVVIKTSLGDIYLDLDKSKAPKTVENFLNYVDEKFYDGTIFHRVINNFMIQGGGFTPDMNQKPTKKPIENEANNGLKNEVGTIAMARTGDPHSATAQFFINVKNNSFLNYSAPNPQGWGYAVFGKVTKGMEVVNAIKGVETHNVKHFQNVPTKEVVILSIERVSSE